MTREEAKKEIEELTRLINYHNELYYQQSRSEISDQQFDDLLVKLTRLEDQFPEFKSEHSPTQRVGGTVTKTFETVYHRYPMLSLGNTYSRKELQEFDGRVSRGLNEPYEYFCEIKFDGVAISLTYEDGILKRAVTRGDGTKGDNITQNTKTIRSIPLKVSVQDIPAVFEARGEVFMPRDVFNNLNRQREQAGEPLLANPRNTASGTLKMQDSSIVARRKLDCFLYSLLGEDLDVHEHSQRIELLEKWGFKVSPTYKKCSNIHEVFEYIDYWEKRRLELPVDTDGVVIKVNNLRQQEKLGYTAKSPRWAISYKYKSLDASTELLKVTYQVGRTGAITPVANLRPVKLAGTEVKRASLHNANEILRLDLREGDTVFVVKGGEIIPKITGVDLTKRKPNSKAIEYVDHCPACDTKLVRNEGEAVHYCPNNKGCPTQIIGRIEHFIQRQAMDIDSLGGRTIALLFEKGLVKTPADLYKLKYEDIYQLEGFKDQSTRNLLNGIEGSKESPFPNVLFALGIRFVGKTVAENLASRFENIDNLANASYEELIATPEIGERIAGSVVEYFKDPDNIRLIDELKSTGLCFETKNINIDSANHVLNGKTFVISGVFENYERDDLKELIKNKGGKVLSSVSAKLDYLLAGENMGPAKREKAQQLGVKIISEKDFINMIE
jgi:DNA ligase (NAD+)